MLDIVYWHSLHHGVRVLVVARVEALCLSMLMHHKFVLLRLWYSLLLIVLLTEERRVLSSFELVIHSLVIRSSVIASIIEALLRMKKIMWMVRMIVLAHILTV